MRFDVLADTQRLVDAEIAESPSLEFTPELQFGARVERTEALKDLTAMGNGGGGTVLYGVDDANGDWPAAFHRHADDRPDAGIPARRHRA